MKKKELKKKKCSGCEDNYYNQNPERIIGDKEECWNLDGAELVEKVKVHMSSRPPWHGPVIEVPDCYHQKDYVFIDADDPRVELEGDD